MTFNDLAIFHTHSMLPCVIGYSHWQHFMTKYVRRTTIFGRSVFLVINNCGYYEHKRMVWRGSVSEKHRTAGVCLLSVRPNEIDTRHTENHNKNTVAKYTKNTRWFCGSVRVSVRVWMGIWSEIKVLYWIEARGTEMNSVVELCHKSKANMYKHTTHMCILAA